MDDLISRQAAIDALRMDTSIIPFFKAREYANAVIETIYNRLEQLPSAQQWIYVEEALPETVINEHTKDYREYICLCDFGKHGFDVRTYKFGNGHFWACGGDVDKYVTAWQPLPKVPEELRAKT